MSAKCHFRTKCIAAKKTIRSRHRPEPEKRVAQRGKNNLQVIRKKNAVIRSTVNASALQSARECTGCALRDDARRAATAPRHYENQE